MNRLLLLSCLLVWGGTALAVVAPAPLPLVYRVSSFVADSLPPVVVCPPDTVIQLGTGECSRIVNYTVDTSDNVGVFLFIQATGLPSGAAFPIGVTLNTFVAADAAGNTASCSFKVEVKQLTGTLFCQDLVILKLIPTECMDTLRAAQTLEGQYGCTDAFIVEIDRVAPANNGPWSTAVCTAQDLGKTYGFRVRDPASGNSCWGNLQITDSVSITCKNLNLPCAVDSITPAFLRDSLALPDAFPLALHCGPATLTHADLIQPQPCDSNSIATRIITRQWTLTPQGAILPRTCTQNIVMRRTFQGLRIPPNITVDCGSSIQPQAIGEPGFRIHNRDFDLLPPAICNFDYNFFDTLVEPFCGGGERIKRTWKVYNLCEPHPADDPFIGVQFITIIDTLGPALVCPPNITVSTLDTNCVGTVNLPDFPIFDACSDIVSVQATWTAGGAPQSLNGSIAADTLMVFGTTPGFPVGTTQIQYLAADTCGNTGVCTFNLSVWDQTSPEAVCDSLLTVYLEADGTAFLEAEIVDNGSSDACNPILFKARRALNNGCQPSNQMYDRVKFCCENVGDTLAVELRVYDIDVPSGSVPLNFGQGHYSACTAQVVVLDTLPPTCTAPPDTVTTCDAFDPTLVSYGSSLGVSCKVDSLALDISYAQFDTLCKTGTILRIFHVFDEAGNSGVCTQTIVSERVQDYYVRFPDDVLTADCSASADYGEPQFFGLDCENMDVSYTDEIFTVVPDACYRIDRTWRIVNACAYNDTLPLTPVPNPTPHPTPNNAANLAGPVVSAPGAAAPWAPSSTKINPTDAQPTNFSVFWDQNSNGYTYVQIIKIIDITDPVALDCPSDSLLLADSTANHTQLWDMALPGQTAQPRCETAADLHLTGYDLCDVGGAQPVRIRCLLFLDVDNNGVTETVVDSENLPAAGTVRYNNQGNPNYAGGDTLRFDQRVLPADQLYRFTLDTVRQGDTLTTRLRWHTAQQPDSFLLPQLPHGRHRVRWILEDACGNERVCEYRATVRDTTPPVIVCSQLPPVDILANDTLTIYFSDIILDADDACSPPVALAIRRENTGTGFPLDNQGLPQSQVVLTCDDLGEVNIEGWGRDASGNTAECIVQVVVQDISNYCGDPGPDVAGFIKTEYGSGVQHVAVELQGQHPANPSFTFNTQTDSLGAYSFPGLPPASDITITPAYDSLPLNGVSTYDLLLISRHILGLEPLDSPYKIIAADANRSGSITSFDIVEYRKLILGIYNELPNNTSWRFVDSAFVFTNPDNPFADMWEEPIARTDVDVNLQNLNFIAIKTGDLNGNAQTNFLAPTDERHIDTLPVYVADRPVTGREIFTVPLRFAQPLLSCQFTLETAGLEVVDIVMGPEMSADNFAILSAEGAVTVSWNAPGNAPLRPDFNLRLRSQSDGRLSDMLGLSGRITRAEAYPALQHPYAVDLRYDGATTTKGGVFELYQNIPNPTPGKTIIAFTLPEAGPATLRVTDTAGRLLYEQSSGYTPGYHEVVLNTTLFGVDGVLFYQLETPKHSAVKKMVVEGRR